MTTAVPFQSIPANIRTPLFYAEVSATQANTSLPVQRTLILGQKVNVGTGVLNSVTRIASTQDGIALAGANSLLAQLLQDYRLNDPMGEVWLGILHDGTGATAATGSITFTAVATANGTYTVYIGGRKYQMAVTSSMVLADLAASLVSSINHDKYGTVTASTVSGGLVTLTADNQGLHGNDTPIFENWYGSPAGEVMPAGLATTIVQLTGGATPPDLSTLLANCADKSFDFIVSPYNDTTTLNALKQFLDDTVGRWSWLYQLYGHVFTARVGTLSGLTTFGSNRNNQHESCEGWNNAASPAWRLAAGYAGACAASLRNNPALPLQTVQVLGMMPPHTADRFQITDRQQLLQNGVSTYTVDDDGTLRLDNVITTYQFNTFNQPDDSYLEVETMFTIVAVLRALRTAVTSKYARVLLAANGTPLPPGPNGGVVTPAMIKAELIAQYRTLCLAGLCQNPEKFKAGLYVEIDANNPNRVNVLYDPVLMGQLRIFALLFQFSLM